MTPAVRARHEPGGDARLGDGGAHVLELGVGGGHLLDAQLVEQGLVVDHDILGGVVPQLEAVQLAAGDAGGLAGLGHHVLPVSAGEVDAAVLGIADVGLDGAHGVGLDPEHVGAGAVLQVAGQHVQILVGGHGLQIHGHAVGLLKALDGLVIAVAHPVLGHQDAQLLALELALVGNHLHDHVLRHRGAHQTQRGTQDQRKQLLHVVFPSIILNIVGTFPTFTTLF